MTTTNRDGRPPLSELPELEAYSDAEWLQAEQWPAIARYRRMLTETAKAAPTDFSARLRLKRHALWLRCALATHFDRATAREVCLFWSNSADGLIADAWQESGCAQTELTLLALGKLGAQELNLSSDVDLIFVRPDHHIEQKEVEIKCLRRFQELLTDSTEFASVLRVDLNLRPGGRASSVIPSFGEFEYHYGYHGEMWERLAYVRLRVLHGPKSLSDELVAFARKFSFRKHLDYTLIDELKGLRAKIRAEKFIADPGWFHLKLGPGGIRELELFVHALQVMHGGRHPLLQTNSTSLAIEALAQRELLPESDCEMLSQSYWFLRTLENRLHAFEDQQDYLVNLNSPHQALRLTSASELEKTRAQVTTIATSLFGEDRADDPARLNEDEHIQRLQRFGFSEESVRETWPQLLSATALSRKSETDERARLLFLAGFTEKLAELKLDLDLGLLLLLDFVRATRAKASFFTLLNREPKVRDQLALLFSISPYLGSLLTLRPELVDEFIYQRTAEPSPNLDLFLEELAERRLLSELVGASQFLESRDLKKLTLNLSSNADLISSQLLQRLKSEYGADDLQLLALGKWGGRELGLRSDLDFVFVTENEPTAEAQKTAKRFLSRMTEPHRGGAIYSIDLRLRPSGNSGPIMVSRTRLQNYLASDAAAWERQSYLRSRAIGDLDFQPARDAARRGLSPDDSEELGKIRAQLFHSSEGASAALELDLKFSVGGLADVEFSAQIALLALREFSLDPSTCGMVQCLEGLDGKWAKHGPELRANYQSLRLIEQMFQLTTSQTGSKMRTQSDEFRRLAMVLHMTTEELEQKVRGIFVTLSETLNELRLKPLTS